MDTNRWRRVNELFDQALKQPQGARERFLRQACGTDEQLLREVQELLDADGAQSLLLDGVAANAVDMPGSEIAAGEKIGAYRVLRKLGVGGMGEVYLAERADGHFEQQVALKLIKRGMDSTEILGRFAAERQILARLEHPHIGRLLDGGAAADGRPYYAMEYVDGEPLTVYCDRERLSVEDRLHLFMTVCDAVEYAQERLVVHRDLKPSNILVGADGKVKLLDFGIAKVLGGDARGVDGDARTRTGIRVMTPAYAAPEQVRGDEVTTATDVYALGVILFELLTGRRPLALDGLSAREMEAAIESTEPSRPSQEVSSPTAPASGDAAQRPSPAEIAERRGLEVERLRRRLSGDLDNICLMALRKQPTRRYATAGQLKDDIRRHLNGLPVRARPDTLSYRAQKFLARHRVAVMSAAALVLTGVALVSFYTYRLAAERDRARMEAEKARAVSDFLGSLFETADPTASGGDQVTARQMLDLGAERIRDELADQPEVQADMMQVIAQAYRNIGLYDPAQSLLHQSLAILRELFGSDHADVATAISRLADIMYYQGDLDSCMQLTLQALTLQRRLHGEMHTEVALALNNLGWLDWELGDLSSAESLHTQALAIRRELHPEDHHDIAESIGNLASVAYAQGSYEKAERLYREALAMNRRLLGADHPFIAANLNNLGLALEALEEYAEAESCYVENLEISTRLYGENNHQLADAHSFLGRLSVAQKDYARGEQEFRQALQLRQNGLGPDHYLVGYDRKNLGDTYLAMGAYAAADSNYRIALTIFEQAFPEGNTFTAGALLGLGQVLTELGRPTEAEPRLRRAAELREAASGPEHWEVVVVYSAIGDCLATQGRFEEAESILLHAHESLQANRGDSDRHTRLAAARLADLYNAWGKPDLASPYAGKP